MVFFKRGRMKKIFFLLGVFLVVLLFCSGCTTPVSQRSYTNAVYGFSLNPPAGWSVVESESPMIAVRFVAPKLSNASLVVDAPIMVSEGRALSTYADQLEETFSENTVNFSVMSRQGKTIGGLDAYEIVCSYEDNHTVFQVKQVAVVKTRTVFIITFVASSERYDTYNAVVDGCIDSFIIT
jgi:hypothetical protein